MIGETIAANMFKTAVFSGKKSFRIIMQKMLIHDKTILIGETKKQNTQEYYHIEGKSVIPKESFNEQALAKSNCSFSSSRK